MNPKLTTLPAWSELLDDPLDSRLTALSARLAEGDGPADEDGGWPASLWDALREAEAPLWAIPDDHGGRSADKATILQRYARIAEGSLTAAFILSQHDAAVRRLSAAKENEIARDWLRNIARGDAFSTVGISHLTTSRRLGTQPMLAKVEPGGYRMDGTMPWVTAAERADVLVTGAPLGDGRQFLVALPANRDGVKVAPAFPLAALQASLTTEVVCRSVRIEDAEILAGPAPDVMSHPGAAGTGGLETTAIALGQARAAILALAAEAPAKAELTEPTEALATSWRSAWVALSAASAGGPEAPTPGQARAQANALALRSTQAYLAARKGTGFLRTEAAQRWARQALFFLVWSCPSPVAQANIRDLAGVCSI